MLDQTRSLVGRVARRWSPAKSSAVPTGTRVSFSRLSHRWSAGLCSPVPHCGTACQAVRTTVAAYAVLGTWGDGFHKSPKWSRPEPRCASVPQWL